MPELDRNDIALAKLASPIYGVPLVYVDSLGGDYLDEITTVSGWGRLTENEQDPWWEGYPDRLYYVHIPVVSMQSCRDISEWEFPGNTLCAGEPGRDVI